MDDLIKPEKAVTVVGEVLQVAKNNADARIAGEYAAKSLAVIAKTVHSMLLPLAAFNYGAESAKQYFESKFESDLAAKTARLPEERIVAPKASVAAPVLQGLAFSHDEDSLRDLYLELLATAMDSDNLDSAHPAFAEIVRQLASNEVPLLQAILGFDIIVPLARLSRTEDGTEGEIIVFQHLLDTRDSVTGARSTNSRTAIYVDNWIRLGLVNVDYQRFLVEPGRYDWVTDRQEFLELQSALEGSQHLGTTKGILEVTAFGRSFAEAVGIRSHGFEVISVVREDSGEQNG